MSPILRQVRVGHSPDPDDAFMMWAFHAGKLDTKHIDIRLVPEDIESLNQRAESGADPLEVTALSAATYARLSTRYRLFRHGASFGDDYGPILVSRDPSLSLEAFASGEHAIATPGARTTAYATLRMALPDARCEQVPFDEILPRVQDGTFAAGLLIHEGQLTWAREGVHKLLDLGKWWAKETGGLPLPLGVNTLRTDVADGPDGALVSHLIKEAIDVALSHRADALAYAQGFGRGIPTNEADTLVGMYVNDMTQDMGARGEEALREWVRRAAKLGLVPSDADVRFV